MDKQNLMPQAAGPVNRITTGQLPESLAELSEEALQQHECDAAAVSASDWESQREGLGEPWCSYDGDDAE